MEPVLNTSTTIAREQVGTGNSHTQHVTILNAGGSSTASLKYTDGTLSLGSL